MPKYGTNQNTVILNEKSIVLAFIYIKLFVIFQKQKIYPHDSSSIVCIKFWSLLKTI